MNISLKRVAFPALICSAFLLSACGNKNTEHSDEVTPEDKVMQELSSEAIRNFDKTPNDQHDILLLVDYDYRYTQVSDEMEDELIKLSKSGDLTAEFSYTRKKDNLVSASEMLKNLDLKTEQGRYIQGLIAGYWDQQLKLLEQHKDKTLNDKSLSEDKLKGLGGYLHAQDQLENWRSQYPEIEAQLDP
ncbi:hypothetical protein SKM54_07495 [Acinetobacter faecalis]|uniref:hypothetical protein n=1 Tax=Acinetobacter faecalis TaxID=2665161 RepID=UPI002A910D96|nr:hypothetical protein [Acinetobacter faecalis]MDY6482284.1 hypothetical protein [Acinetobacter faecalis]